MAFVTAEDMTGAIECLIFPKIYAQLKHCLIEDNVVVLEGRLSLREDEEPKLVLNNAMPITEAKRPPSSLRNPQPTPAKDSRKLYLKFCLGKDYLLERVKPVLAAHKGSVPVCIHIEETKSTAIAPQMLWVTPENTLLGILKEMLGEENVVLK